ncbi:MAG: inorganic pyrophosphatase [Thermoanaerobaculia bacterium]
MQDAPRFRLHPWHGIDPGPEAPAQVNAYIEIVPTDTVKYELDKATGYLRVDRPQKFSNVCPSLYGFIPQTYCGDEVGAFAAERAGRESLGGDGDPLDICVLTEKAITHGDILVAAIVIGGLRMLDQNEADDKLVAVMQGDAVYGGLRDIEKLPDALVARLKHYFLTYKLSPEAEGNRQVEITHVYGREEAWQVYEKSRRDYERLVGAPKV